MSLSFLNVHKPRHPPVRCRPSGGRAMFLPWMSVPCGAAPPPEDASPPAARRMEAIALSSRMPPPAQDVLVHRPAYVHFARRTTSPSSSRSGSVRASLKSRVRHGASNRTEAIQLAAHVCGLSSQLVTDARSASQMLARALRELDPPCASSTAPSAASCSTAFARGTSSPPLRPPAAVERKGREKEKCGRSAAGGAARRFSILMLDDTCTRRRRGASAPRCSRRRPPRASLEMDIASARGWACAPRRSGEACVPVGVSCFHRAILAQFCAILTQ